MCSSDLKKTETWPKNGKGKTAYQGRSGAFLTTEAERMACTAGTEQKEGERFDRKFFGRKKEPRCLLPNCPNPRGHYMDGCDAWFGMLVGDRWKVVTDNEICEHCLRHDKKPKTCYLARKTNGPQPCGQEGCAEFHHPTLHRPTTRGVSCLGYTVTLEEECSPVITINLADIRQIGRAHV